MDGDGPKLAFLPSSGRQGASLLRAYLIADALAARGWRNLVLPHHLARGQRLRVLRRFKPDLLFVQGARHALNDPAHFGGAPYVFDLDDADFGNPAMCERLTRICTQAQAVIGGSRYVADWMRRYNPKGAVVWTGAPVTESAQADHARRKLVVTWAQAEPLGYPVEFSFVQEVILGLKARGADFSFRLYGWRNLADRAPIARMEQAGVSVELCAPMPYAAFVASLRETAVGLSAICPASAFSKGKSFGKILAYLDARVPVIASDEADHALFFDAETGVVSNSPDVWVDAAVRLLADPGLRDRMANAAHQRMCERLSTEAAAAQIDAFLRSLLNAPCVSGCKGDK